MPLRAVLRVSAALWAGPLLLLLGIYQIGTLVSERTGYPLADWGRATTVVFLIAPCCAALCAYETGRLRAGGVWSVPAVRPRWMIVTMQCAVPVAVCLVVLAGLGLMHAPGTVPPVLIVLTVALLLVAHAALGAAAGLRLSRGVAVPAVLLASYLWLVLPITVQPLWVRHLTGYWTSCCSIDTDLSPAAVTAAAVVNLGLIGAAALLITTARRVRVLPGSALLVILAIGAGSTLVAGMGPDPVTPRAAATTCSDTDPAICVWPEHTDALPRVVDALNQAAPVWRDLGVALPETFTERLPDRPGQLLIGVDPLGSTDTYLATLAYALVAPMPSCAASQPFESAALRPVLHLWLLHTAGGAPEIIGPTPQEQAIVERVIRASPAQQTRWYERLRTALSTCQRPDPDIVDP